MVVLTAYDDEMLMISTACHANPGQQQHDQDIERHPKMVYATTA